MFAQIIQCFANHCQMKILHNNFHQKGHTWVSLTVMRVCINMYSKISRSKQCQILILQNIKISAHYRT